MLNAIKQIIARLDQLPLVSFEQQLWQRKTTVQPTGFSRWINLLLAWSVLLVSVALYVIELLRALMGGDLNIVPYQLRWIMGVYALLAFVFYTTPWRRGQTLAQQIIARDRSKAHNWELVVLTGVDTRAYVRAKWWAIVRALFPALLPAAIVRAGAVTFLVGEFTRAGVANVALYAGNGISIYPPSAFDIFMVGVLSFVLTYATLPTSVASYVNGSLNSRQNSSTWWEAFVNRMTMLAMLVGLIGIALALFAGIGAVFQSPLLSFTLGFVLFTLFDNGFSVTSVIAAYVYVRQSAYVDLLASMTSLHAGLIVLLALPGYWLLTLLWLNFAEWRAKRAQLVSPDPVQPREKRFDAQKHVEPIG